MKSTNSNFLKIRNTRFKALLKLGIFLLVILIGLSIFINQKVKKKIVEIVGLSCEEVDVSWLFRKASFDNLTFSRSEGDADSSYFTCKKITLNGIKWWSLIANKELKINELRINDLKGNIKSSNIKKDSVTNDTQQTPQLKAIFVDKIFLNNINIEYSKRKHFETKVEDFSLQLHQLQYDLALPLKAIKYQGFTYALKNASWIPKEDNYAVFCKSAEGNSEEKSFLFQEIELQPLHSKKNWYRNFKYKKARLAIKASDIKGEELDYQKLLDTEGLDLKKLSIENLNLDVYIDKKSPPCIDCYKPFLHEKLLGIKLPITVEKVELKNNQIDIEVVNEKNEQAAKVDFQKIYASIYNVTNESNKIKNNPVIVADVKTMFLGKEELNAKINFDLSDELNAYQIAGEMQTMDLTAMNDILKFGTKAKIKSGILNQLNFKLEGNQEVSTGKMAFNYENLEVEIMNQEKSKSKKLLSKLVNKIGIKKDNSISEGNFKEGKIYYTRKKNKGTFHHWWRAIQSGFQSTIMPNILLPDELEVD